MRRSLLPAALLVLAGVAHSSSPQEPRNPHIDYDAFVHDAAQVRELRSHRRLTEEDFVRMSADPGTVVLDARSERLYRMRHVRGAVNLSFPEFTAETLAVIIPTPETRVLIYCNNNFDGAPQSMPLKAAASALNVSTFVSLYSYGYRNVYELGPAVDVRASKLAFEGSETRP